jgi:hypothetical protein
LSHRAWPVAALLAVVIGMARPARPMEVLRLGFDAVVDRSARIVHGTVRAVASGRDAAGIPSTWVTLEVTECLKGHAERSLTFKQLGVQEPLPDGTWLRMSGLPRYRVGDEIVVFLHAPSGRGFTSPVGLGQGLYRAEPRAEGRAVRSSLATSAAPSEDLAAFLERVRRRVAP